jgi:hypothetical protein
MTIPENPFSRWSRLKRGTVSKRRADGAPEDPRPGSIETAGAEPEGGLEEGLAVPQDLPPIDGITFDTDIRAFLKTGVPAELTRAALRRAWTSDPMIRDFIGIAENQWDFNDPGAIPGFGPLQATDDISVIVRQALVPSDEFAGTTAELANAVQPVAPAEPIGETSTSDQADISGAGKTAPVTLAEIGPRAEQDRVAPSWRRAHVPR